MSSSFLRKFRVVFSALVFVSFFFVFVDFKSLIPEKYVSYLLFLQFVPSAISYVNTWSLAATGFIIVIFLTLITGRTYCSFLCPLGIGQDINSRIGGKLKKKFRRFGFRKPHSVIRYSLLVLTLGSAVFYGIYLVTLLDPYSIFGRFMTFFAKPVVLVINNLFSGLLGKFDIYTLNLAYFFSFTILVYY